MISGMKIDGRTSRIILFLGDILAFVLALWLTLFVRYRQPPSGELFFNHLTPFSFIFLIWLISFVIADLYQRPFSILGQRLSVAILNTQAINSIIALAFFYFIPYFGITPKITLFIDLLFTYILIFVWRRYLANKLIYRRRGRIIFLCQGKEVDEVKKEIISSNLYEVIDSDDIRSPEDMTGALVVIDPHDDNSKDLFQSYYQLIFHGVSFVSIYNLYEELFNRIPVSLLKERWFVENISNQPKPFYDFFKRVIDLIVSLTLGILSLVFYPFVWLALTIEGGDGIFSIQERVGQNNLPIKIFKFRTMRFANDRGEWNSGVKNEVTRVGRFLRKTRIDELPQLWNVVRGDISLIGPRPEFPAAVKFYSEQIPYYDARHLIKPGLSGWAQIYGEHPHHETNIELTKNKLSYDLYYVKHRNLWLDIFVVLRTIKTLLSMMGK